MNLYEKKCSIITSSIVGSSVVVVVVVVVVVASYLQSSRSSIALDFSTANTIVAMQNDNNNILRSVIALFWATEAGRRF